MMSGTGFEVVHIQMGTKNKINKNTRRERVSRGGTQQKYTLENLNMWAPAVCTQASLPHKHMLFKAAQGHSFDPLACYLI